RHTRFSRDWSSDVCSSDLRCQHGTGQPSTRFSSMSEDQKLVVQNSVTGFFQELGGELLEFEPDRAVIGLTLEKRHLNNAGNLHGGVVASLLEDRKSVV